MEKFCDLLNRTFLDIFALFSLGMRKSSLTMQYCLLFINSSIPLVILGFYLSKGTIFVSADPLSKMTDIFEMFFPFSVHIFVIISQTANRKIFYKINALMDLLDEIFKNHNREKFIKAKINSTLGFLLKFLIVHVIGCGIECFNLIT